MKDETRRRYSTKRRRGWLPPRGNKLFWILWNGPKNEQEERIAEIYISEQCAAIRRKRPYNTTRKHTPYEIPIVHLDDADALDADWDE